jgi:catechol 2,3-dioxygenase-like lactoylglutathione lyase family enzyme
MKINHVEHIAINTIDIDESIAYYKKMFGFELVKRVDMGSCELVYLKVDERTKLELFNLRGNCEQGDVANESMQGLRHIAFQVDDINAWNNTLKDRGAEFTMELTRMEPIRMDGILIRDPNGVIIELCASY